MKIIIALLILLSAIPAGLILKNYTKEEMLSGKKYFKILWILCPLASVILFFSQVEYNLKMSAIFGLLFISIVSFISWRS